MISYIVFGLLFAAWEFFFYMLPDLRLVISSPTLIVKRLFTDSSIFYHHTVITFFEMFMGFSIAFILSFPMALLMNTFRIMKAILEPIFIVIQCIPLFTLAPIMIIIFDWSQKAIWFTTALMIFFPLTISLFRGLSRTPLELVEFFKLHNATFVQTYWKLKLPWAVPDFCSGLKVSAGVAGIGALGGEWAGGQEGLGVLMMEARRGGDYEQSFAALFCLVFITLSLYGFITMLEKGLLKKFLKRTAIAASFILLAFSSCQESKNQEVKMVLDWLPNPDHVPLYVGIEKGFFQKQGVSLRILKNLDPGDVLPYVTSKQADLAVFYTSDTITARKHGALVKPASNYIAHPLNAFICLKSANISSIEDLNDKVIGYCVTGYGRKVINRIFTTHNIKPKELRNVSYDLVTSLGTKKVDALYGAFFNIEGEHLRSLGIETTHIKMNEFGIPIHSGLIIVTHENTDEKFLAAFRKGLKESLDYSKKHPEEAFNIYLRFNPDKGEKTIAWERKAWDVTYPLLADDTEVPWESWHKIKEWMETNELL